jgi:hypothetical protein
VGSRWVQVPQLGWEAMVVVVTPQDAGRPTARSELAEVADGACRWAVPIFETTKLPTGKDKIYQFLVYETVSHRPPPLNDSRLTAADFSGLDLDSHNAVGAGVEQGGAAGGGDGEPSRVCRRVQAVGRDASSQGQPRRAAAREHLCLSPSPSSPLKEPWRFHVTCDGDVLAVP